MLIWGLVTGVMILLGGAAEKAWAAENVANDGQMVAVNENQVLGAEQKTAIAENCEAIKESLQAVQRNDARARVYLGRKYETILSKYVTPLNVWLVENNLSDAGLIENQSTLAERRTKFVNDYVAYQQGLEDLVATDCRGESEKFYEKLVAVREQRARVRRDTERMQTLTQEQVKLVKELELKLLMEEGK